MSVPIQSALVRIWSMDGQVIGAGFLVLERHVLTCAHVLSSALGLRRQKMPKMPISIDFPLVAPRDMQTAIVTVWLPRQTDGTGDIAGLELQGNLPIGVRPVQLITASDVWNHSFRAFGFPIGHDDGVYATGVLRAATAVGYIHIEDIKTAGYAIQPGFSGTPVWDETLRGVVGMVVTSERQKEPKAAFIIPTTILSDAWPELPTRMLSASVVRFLPNSYDRMPQHYIPRPELLETMKSILLNAGRDQLSAPTLKLDALHGMGGIGKSVTARALCDDPDIQSSFPDGILWTTFGQNLTEADLRTKLCDWIYALDGTTAEIVPSLDSLKMSLTNLLRERACLLVLDDVWQQSDATWFLVDSPRSRFLLTSRDAVITESLGAIVHPIPGMTHDEAIALLSAWAQNRLDGDYPDLTAKIVKRLGYLPLALKLAGSQLRTKEPVQWLDTFQAQKLTSRRPETLHDNLYDTFAISLNDLSVNNRSLYLTLSIFKGDKATPTVAIARLWSGLVNLNSEDVRELLQDLADRALLQLGLGNAAVSLHDLLRDYITDELSQADRQAAHRALLNAYRQTQTNGGWSTAPNDGYLFGYLPYHLREAGHIPELQQLMLDSDWLHVQENHQPSLQNYLTGLHYASETAISQGPDGLPHVVAYGLIKGTITTATYKISSQQIKQMIDLCQIDSILEWAARLPSTMDWFRIDLLQLAGEVALLNGQVDRARDEFKRAVEQLDQIASTHVSELLIAFAVDFVSLNDKSSIRNLLAIAERMPDFPWNRKPQTLQFLQQVYDCLDQGGEVDTLLKTYHLDEYPAIVRLTGDEYVNSAPDSFIRAAKSSISMLARWAELLYACGESKHALSAFIQAEKMLAFMKPDEPIEQAEALGRLVDVAVAIGQPGEKIQNFLNDAISITDQTVYSVTKIYTQIHLANTFTKLGHYVQASELLNRINKQLWREPNTYQKAHWLSQLAPCAPLARDAAAFIASHLPDEEICGFVIQIWQTYLGDVNEAEALLALMELKPNDTLNYFAFQAIIPFLRGQSTDALKFEGVWRLSQQSLEREKQWQWLGKALAVFQPDERILGELLNALKLRYAQISKEQRVQSVSYVAPSLTSLCTLDPDWSLSVLQKTLYRQEPYHRSVVQFAIEQFAPVILKLAGKEIFVETWNKINAVERMFFQDFFER